jgi:hypothetical protein
VYGFIQWQYWDVGLLRFYKDPGRARLPLLPQRPLLPDDCRLGVLLIGGCVMSPGKTYCRTSKQQR